MRNAIGLLCGITAVSVLLAVSPVHALTWENPNTPDANTIALFHFDEGSGLVTHSTDSIRSFTLTENLSNWTPAPAWMATPSGTCLTGTNTITQTVGISPSQYEMDWSRPAITISFWMRDDVSRPQENCIIYMGYDWWRDQQVYIGYRPGNSNPARLMYAGSGFYDWQWDTSLVTDGQWHHVAFVGVRGGDGQTTLKYYVDNVQRNFMYYGSPVATVSFTPTWTTAVTEFWYLMAGSAASVDELLIQASEITDFANGINAPAPGLKGSIIVIM